MSDEYDPDNFDWGDQEGIPLDDLGPDIIEQAIQAALNVHEEKYGWRFLKRTAVNEGAGRLFKVNYFMPNEGKEWFETNFPGYTFVWDGALSHHDHPVSNLCRELNEIEMVESFVRDNVQYIDLFGSGSRDARYKRNCINMFALKTPKDYIRYQNRGPRDFPYDLEKLCNRNTVVGKIENICITHALYYMTMADIGRIVNTSQKRRMRALVHRHKDTHGFLNGGEQEYWVSEKGVVTQVNVATGEKYEHPSLEALFHQGSAKTLAGGVAWTIRAAGGDSFIIDFVGCPNDICETFVPLNLLKPESWEKYTYNNVSVTKFLGWSWMSASTSRGEVVIEDLDLFNKLRRYVAGKERTPRLKTETMNQARRLCNKLDIISIHGGGAHEVPVASMADYVEVAFHVDMRHELETALSFHRDNEKMTGALNKFYSQGIVPKDMTVVTGTAVWTSKTFSDAAIRVINHVKNCNEISVQNYIKNNLPGEDLAILAVDYGPDEKIGAPWGWAIPL